MGKTITLKDLQEELPDKQKSVDDIIRFIRNRNDDNPNYSLMLGAGASVSSGIASGSDLTKQWRKGIYEALEGSLASEPYNEESAVEFLQAKHARWYDGRNEYASLFEYKYNLPKQRRIFVEQEVANKTPSIGYTYLVRLVEKEYFRTIFTTNFDDLLNFSFYNFSTKCRPIVCAHDSSINSITVTSKRPKIIKLHGDYLFDDIKCTNGDTESLEDNMQSKFIEFAKDYGLIVVGYGGNDRSILDVLNFLLKQEDYFGHGIYWCVLDNENTVINEEVRKILWKDKVYYVPITGFDEFFAEISNKILPKTTLPYETRIGVDIVEMLQEIKEGEDKFSHCKYILSDLNSCKKNIQKAALSNQRKVFELTLEEQKDEFSSNRDDFEEIIKKHKVEEKITEGEYSAAITEATQILDLGLRNHNMISELHKMIAYCYQEMSDNEQAINTLKKLIAINDEQKKGDNSPIIRRIALFIKNTEARINFLEQEIKKSPSDYKLYALLAHAYIELTKESFSENNWDSKIIKCFDESIEKNPSRSNMAYFDKFNFLLKKAEAAEDYKKCEEIIRACEVQDKYDEDVVAAKVSLQLRKKASITEISTYVRNVKKENPRYFRNVCYDRALLDALEEKGNVEEIHSLLLEMDEHHLNDCEYQIGKSRILLSKFRNLSLSTELLQNSLKRAAKESDIVLVKKALIGNYFYASELQKAKDLIATLPKALVETKSDLEMDYLIENGDVKEAVNLLDKIKSHSSFVHTKKFYMQYSYNLLKADMYDQVITSLKPILEQIHYASDILVINYELAKKLSGQSPKPQRLQKVIEKTSSEDIKAAAFSIMSKQNSDTDYQKACDLIKTAIGKNYGDFYRFKRFPVFKNINLDNYALPAIPYETDAKPKLELIQPAA